MTSTSSPTDSINRWKPSPVVAGFLAFFLWQFAFLYVNSARWFIAYLTGQLILALAVLQLQLSPAFLIYFSFLIIGHVVWRAIKYDRAQARHWYSKWWGVTGAGLLFLLCLFIVRTFFFEVFRIPAVSMLPTLKVGDFIVVNKLGYGSYGAYGIKLYEGKGIDASSLERGKMYVFRNPRDQVPYVKRLFAVPGDSVKIQGSNFELNGKEITARKVSEDWEFSYVEETLDERSYTTQISLTTPLRGNVDLTLEEGKVFFLGDNRARSLDSRYFGPVSISSIVGEVVQVISPGIVTENE